MKQHRKMSRSCWGTGLLGLAAATLACGGCGGGKDDSGQGKAPSGAKVRPGHAPATGPALTPLPMGKADLAGYAYSLGRASRTFQPIKAAEARGDWKRVESVARSTIMADPGHLSAHWRLALALARQGRHAEVTAPLSAAVAGDWMRWGARSLSEPALASFLSSPEGARYRSLADHYRDRYRRVLGGGMLVVGRRGKPWLPKAAGNGNINHRSEIYAYDVAKGRFLRVSRTNATLVGFLRDPAGPRLLYVSYRRVWTPTPAQQKAGARPYLRRVRIGLVDLAGLRMSQREVQLQDVRSVALWYGTGKRGRAGLFARVVSATAKSPAAAAHTFRIDVNRGKATAIADGVATESGETLVVAYDSVQMRRARVAGVHADWGDDASAGALRLATTRKTITFPAGEFAWRDSLAWSAGRTRLAVSTRAKAPCSEEQAERTVKLYVIDAASGKLRPVAVGEGDFAPQWMDQRRLAYVDSSRDEPAVRIVDVTTGAEIARLETRGGLGTQRLPTPLACRPSSEVDENDTDEEIDEAPAKPPIKAVVPGDESNSPKSGNRQPQKLGSSPDGGQNAR